MTERFTGKVSGRNMVSNGIYGMIGKRGRYFVGEAIDKLAEYETTEEEGRLVVLPCKVGDIVYKIMCQRDNFDDRPYRIITSVNFRLDMADDIGKTVFLTREEAEKALKEMEGK